MWSMLKRQILSKTGRFAPTPTGQLHIGNAYSALLSLISAKAFGCHTILRIDDLDIRSLPRGCLQGQIDDLAWLGLPFDEGLLEGGSRKPYRQSARSHIYESALEYLNELGFLYPCYCSRKEIAAVAPHAQDEGHIYPGTCRPSQPTVLNLDEVRQTEINGRRPSLRFNTKLFSTSSTWIANSSLHPQHTPQVACYTDLVYGKQSAMLDMEIGDFVVQRKDQVYAYQLACAVDDVLYDCAYVVRGADLITSSHRQHILLAALQTPTIQLPKYAHAGLVVDKNGKRLAKRNHSIQLKGLRESGVKANQIRATLSTMLGGPDTDDIDKMAQRFSWSQVPSKPVSWSLNHR